MSRVIHFEIGVDLPERAVLFYSEVFGWKIEKWQGPMDYWLIKTGQEQPGIDGAILKREDGNFSTVNTIGVNSVDEYLERIVRMGGTVVAPKMPIPGMGYFAYCLDSEGNKFGIMETDPTAH
ncbi:MAG: VOC family protein [Anaerolineaceae bacterium]|nr:VOC family protein [Anaerolineaceae bacterium]